MVIIRRVRVSDGVRVYIVTELETLIFNVLCLGNSGSLCLGSESEKGLWGV